MGTTLVVGDEEMNCIKCGKEEASLIAKRCKDCNQEFMKERAKKNKERFKKKGEY